ncbi:MAG TPA: aminoacyl-tRNA hydrolase [Actinomycetota bacterium]
MSEAALIVGLGNPGPEYERTRHNVGYRVLDLLCARLGVRLKPLKGVRAFSAEARDGGRRVILGRPTTYMNESGEAVGPLCRYYKVEVEDLVVVHDEIDLPVGALRVKRGGGDAGHNGLRSITRLLGPEYLRVRVGVGRPPGTKAGADHVLARFSKAEEREIGIVLEEAADGALLLLHDEVERVQNQVHAPRGDPDEQES